MSIEYVATICPYRGCGCGIYLVIKDGKIIGQEPWKELNMVSTDMMVYQF